MTAPSLIERLDGAGAQHQAIMRSLTKVQRGFVLAGCIHGDFTMATVYALVRKGMFLHVVSAPDGRHGFMELTECGKQVQSILRARKDTL